MRMIELLVAWITCEICGKCIHLNGEWQRCYIIAGQDTRMDSTSLGSIFTTTTNNKHVVGSGLGWGLLNWEQVGRKDHSLHGSHSLSDVSFYSASNGNC